MSVIDAIGDEYTQLLNEFRPLVIDSPSWRYWDTIERLVHDARRYRILASMHQSEVGCSIAW